MDGFVNGAMNGDDTWKGSLIGSLVGVLGGPLGVLLGGSMGMLIGGAVDANDMADNASLGDYGILPVSGLYRRLCDVSLRTETGQVGSRKQ